MANVQRAGRDDHRGDERLRVLIVEDSEDDAFLLCHELASVVSNLEYKRVDNAEQMRAALDGEAWDLVISDHSMPRFSAKDAFEILRASGKDIPFIIYSGTISENIALSAMADGVSDFVEKGDIMRLLPVVRRELRGAQVVQAKQRAESRVYHLSHYDQLTGLPNRTLFYERAEELLQGVRESGASAAVCLLDLDRFMRINNTFGYATGDLLVRRIADRLRERVGARGCVARLGRDEFALMSPPYTEASGARDFADAVMKEFARPFVIDGQEFFITFSMGVACMPAHGDEVSTLLVNAESAMFLAKRSGRNNYQLYAREINAASAERLTMENALRRSVERNELLLHYQPSVDIQSGEISGCEALVRWRHPQQGMVPPDKFIPLADEIGMINEIGRWVLREACTQVRRWTDAGMRPLTISVNVSAVQFREEGLVEEVRAALADTGLEPQRLVLEITESVLMRDVEATIRTLKELKDMGVSISIDDFGTGYSSLSYLRRFPIDTLKVDKSFVRDVTEDADDAAIVRAIITLAKSLKLSVVAEGVETADQLAYLRSQGCDRIQGYFFSRPLDPAAFDALMRSGKNLNS